MADEAGGDVELQAIQVILSTLGGLDSQARSRVVDYVFRRLGLAPQDSALGLADLTAPNMLEVTEGAGSLPPTEARDIRSLKEAKEPKSGVEMAAVVGYYLAELAPPSERKETVSTADLEKYFKQARYPLPKALRVTLATAASSGYFDAVARGQYRLNPVGYNLVAHGLPSSAKRRGRPATKKAAPAKKTVASRTKLTKKSNASR